MACASPQSPVSQEELLSILKKVRDKDLTIDEAIGSVKRNQDSADCKGLRQHNFTVYKYRYRRQKRILQIDFATQMIFNIEKGTLKKQFQFTQVKSCEDGEGLRFLISFNSRQEDYDLEATSADDKQHILKLMNEILQPQRNGQTFVKAYSQKHVFCDVILDGLLERYVENSNTWVKYLVKLKQNELILYCSQHLEPQGVIVILAECSVSAGTQNASPTFTVQSKDDKYIFRIPVNEHNKDFGKSVDMRDDWLSLLEAQCSQSQQSPSPHHSMYEVLHFNHNQTEPPSSPPDLDEKTKMENVTESYNDFGFVPMPKLPNDTGPMKVMVKLGNGFIEDPLIPPCIPGPPPLPTPRRHIPNRTKAFHWNVVPQEKISKSIWGQSSLQKKIDKQRILQQFPASDLSPAGESDISKVQNILLNRKVAHNFNIVLKKFHMEPEQLREKLLIIRESDGGLSDEHLTNLRRYVPTAKDVDMYLRYKGPTSEMHIVDQFMLQVLVHHELMTMQRASLRELECLLPPNSNLARGFKSFREPEEEWLPASGTREMCKIPDLCPRLDTLLTIRELPSHMKYVQPLLLQKIKACNQLLVSQAFPAVLSYVLALGNCLNENAGKEKARGFRLYSLTMMSHLASKEKRFTLMHALVEQILLQEPDLAKFSQELTEFEAVPGASVKGLSAEVDVLSKQVETIDQYRKLFKANHHKASAREEKFLKDLKDIVQQYRAQQVDLVKRAVEMKKLYSDILHKFAEAEDQDSQEMFGWIATFIKEFQSAYADIRRPQR